MHEALKMLTELLNSLTAPDDQLLPAVAETIDRLRAELQRVGFTRSEAVQIICSVKFGK